MSNIHDTLLAKIPGIFTRLGVSASYTILEREGTDPAPVLLSKVIVHVKEDLFTQQDDQFRQAEFHIQTSEGIARAKNGDTIEITDPKVPNLVGIEWRVDRVFDSTNGMVTGFHAITDLTAAFQ